MDFRHIFLRKEYDIVNTLRNEKSECVFGLFYSFCSVITDVHVMKITATVVAWEEMIVHGQDAATVMAEAMTGTVIVTEIVTPVVTEIVTVTESATVTEIATVTESAIVTEVVTGTETVTGIVTETGIATTIVIWHRHGAKTIIPAGKLVDVMKNSKSIKPVQKCTGFFHLQKIRKN